MDLTAAILAGGFGTRLRAVVSDRPKVLAEIRGRPFLAYLLDQVAEAGIRQVVLCTGYLGEQVRGTFGDLYRDLHLFYSREPSPLGTAGALRLALPLLKSNTVLVLNGDSYCDLDLRAFWGWHCMHGGEGTLALVMAADSSRYGGIQVDQKGRVINFHEKDGTKEPGWINAGIYLLSRSLLLTISSSGPVSLEREMFPAWIRRGMYGYRTDRSFLDIGTPETFSLAGQFFASKTGT